MHPNPSFRRVDTERALGFAASRGFGSLAVNADQGPLISHIPFHIREDADQGRVADLHLVRSNPILQHLPAAAVIAVNGPDAYISPDWYEAADQVPTWNYVAVHLRGELERRPAGELPGMLDALSARFEGALAPKSPWTAAKMTPDALDKLLRQIVPCRLVIQDVQSTWKLNQNKEDAVRMRAADQVETRGIGSERAELARLMREA